LDLDLYVDLDSDSDLVADANAVAVAILDPTGPGTRKLSSPSRLGTGQRQWACPSLVDTS